MVSIDSVRPTVATASAPSRDTKNTSTTAKSDSMPISITIGTANENRLADVTVGVVVLGAADRFEKEETTSAS